MGDQNEWPARQPGKAVKRQREAMRLRHEHGLTFAEIAERLGYANKAGAQKAYARAVADGGLAEISDVDWRKVQMHRLEHLYGIAARKADRGDLAAVRECARILDRIDSLQGLAIARGRIPAPQSTSSRGEDDEGGTVVGSERLAMLRDRRARDAAAAFSSDA